MRPPFVLTVVAALALSAGAAHAERVRTTESTKVYKRTGEQSAVLTRVKEGTTLQVVATQGRWLKVRVNGRTGWIMRTSVVSLAKAPLPRNTRRRPFVDGRSVRRDGSADAPEDRVGADAIDGEGDGRELTGRFDDRDDDDDDDRDDRVRDDRRKPDRGDRRARDRGRDDDRGRDRDDDRGRDRGDDRERGDGGDDLDLELGDDEDLDEADAAPTLTVRVARAPLYQRPSRGAARC